MGPELPALIHMKREKRKKEEGAEDRSLAPLIPFLLLLLLKRLCQPSVLALCSPTFLRHYRLRRKRCI